ncbi:MAG: carbohydrate ABC transporter permease [Ruminococcus sp.]|nr:carbohydrate ABC transporter permease [Ruminococcus sp.]
MSTSTTDHVGEHSNKTGLLVRRIVAYTVLCILTFLCLYPFLVMIINATRSHPDIQKGFKVTIGGAFGSNFKNVFNNTDIPLINGLRNSLIVSGCCTILSTYFSALTAYGIHVYEFRLKKFAFAFILVIMMVPAQVSALGFYRMMYDLELTNNLIPLIIPSIAAPSTFFFMKQYMESSLPLEIVEASRIDGCNEFRTFNTIVMPIMKPAMAVQGIFTFVANWNNYFIPSLLIDKKEMKTLPIMVAQLRNADFVKFDMGQVYMMIFIAIIPVIVVYLALSKFIIRGIALGSVKG